jgi:poly-beta-1,6-N-acetyl-D-glucosamine synthase
VPWILLIMFVASWLGTLVWQPESQLELRLLASFAVLQTAFYGLALLGSRAGRLGSAARSFVVLNAAAAVGLWRYMRGELRVTW